MLTTQTGCRRPSTHFASRSVNLSSRRTWRSWEGNEVMNARLAAAMFRAVARLWDGVLRSSLLGHFREIVVDGA